MASIINAGTSGLVLTGSTSTVLSLATNGTTRVNIDTSGNVGIGTASPGVRADISGVMRSATWSLSGTGVTGGTTAFSAGTVSTDTNWGMYFRAGTSSSAVAEYSFRNSADTERMRIDSSGNVGINKVPTTTLDVSGTVSDISGNVRNIPSAGTTKTSPYTLAVTDNGEFVTVGSGGSVTVPNNTFATGNAISVYNDTTGNVSINISTTTAYVVGTNTNRTGVTLATRGIANILFINPSYCILSGNLT